MSILRHIFVLGIIGILVFSCEKEGFVTNPDAGLTFSVDTLYFDTVFTELGTATRSFTIHNPHNEYIKISELRLAKAENSVYRINVDGIVGTVFEDIEIPPNDSVFVFVDATLDPNNNSNILLQQDSIVTITNGKIQDIDLMAWGMDVHLIKEVTISGDETWIADKPYLILNYLYIDSLASLLMDPGVKVFLHKDATIYVGGSIYAVSTMDEPIVFKGDRLETIYEDVPGQWGGIWFFQGSFNNVLDNVQIYGATYGLIVDSVMNENPTLKLSNSIIQHISSIGLLARGSVIDASNTVIANCGSSALALTAGGSYEFNHCTIANRWGGYSVIRTDPSVYITNYYYYKDTLDNGIVIDVPEIRDIEKAHFANSIIWGSLSNELIIDKYSDGGVLNYKFVNCLGRFDSEKLDLSDEFFPGLVTEQPNFISWEDYNFQLDTLSPAKDVGYWETALLYPVDIKGDSRISDEGADIGAYERIEN